MSDRKEFEDWFFSQSNSMSMSDIDVAWDAWQASALRHERVPMTDTDLCEALGIDGSDSWTFDVRDVVEKHHGITTQAKKETP